MMDLRPPLTEAARDRIEQQMYPVLNHYIRLEGVELDIAKYQARENESNQEWARRQAWKLR